MAKGGLTTPVLAGFASGFILILSIILISAATERDVSIYDAIHQDLLKGIAIGKATIEVRSVPEFGMTTGPPICRNQLSDQQVASSMLGTILANASNGERKTYRPVGPDYNGPMPIYDKVKVYIFASNPDFYDENLLSDIQTRAIDFKPVTLEPFGATPSGIIHRYNFTLVVPNGTEIYIDKDLKKPDGSPLTIKELHPDSDFGADFSQGSIPVLYDYEYVQVPAIWFTVDAPEGAKVVDSYLDAIKHVIDAEMSKCVKFKQEHAGWEGRPCPD